MAKELYNIQHWVNRRLIECSQIYGKSHRINRFFGKLKNAHSELRSEMDNLFFIERPGLEPKDTPYYGHYRDHEDKFVPLTEGEKQNV